MKKILLPSLVLVGALSTAAAAQDDTRVLWADLAATHPLSSVPSFQEQGGQVTEEWYTPRLRGSISVLGRVSFPGSTNVTADGLWYSDFFDVGWGVSVEADLLSFVTPHWGIGGYISAGWDEFTGQTLHFFNGDFVNVGNMDQTTVIIGGKFVQRLSPWVTWEGYMGGGMVHYAKTTWSGVDTGIPFSNEELFKPINRGVFELGGRLGVGSRNFQIEFGFGFRWMGGAARGADVSNLVDPDYFYTFILDLGLTLRF
jgi:hypothetical protein